MREAIERIGKSLVQHGPRNDRAYLVRLDTSDATNITRQLEELASSHGYSKISAKVPAWEVAHFVAAGFHQEATIPFFYRDGGAVCFMAKYYCKERKVEPQPQLLRRILLAADAQHRAAVAPLPRNFSSRLARENDAAEMASFCGDHLAGRWGAIHDSASFRAAIEENAFFIGAWEGKKLVSVSAAEVDPVSGSAEMVEFLALPKYRGNGITMHLLQRMERELLARGTHSLFAMVRAYSLATNVAFARNGYSFGGTLTNNTHVSGSLESVNVWHKALPEDPRFGWSSLFSEG